MGRFFHRKILAVLLAALYFATNVAFASTAEANLWSERQRVFKQLKSAPLINPDLLKTPISGRLQRKFPQRTPSSLVSLASSIPSSFGAVRSILLPKKQAGDKAVVFIQDVHMNAEAQRNIGSAIQRLFKNKSVGLVALEGAFSPIDLDGLRAFPDKSALKNVADYLLRADKISGPIHATLTQDGALPPVIGIDDRAHYRANVAAVRAATPRAKEARALLVLLQKQLLEQKPRVFNADLFAFDREVSAYHRNERKLGDYARFLRKYGGLASPSMTAFLEALKIEASLDFSRVEAERARLLEKLLPKLTHDESDTLMNRSVAYRMNAIEHADFYSYLRRLCETHGVGLAQFPQMDAYLRYVLISDTIDVEAVLAEIKLMETGGYQSLARTPEERRLAARSRYFSDVEKLLDFSLTAEEWASYKQGRQENAVPEFDFRPFEAFYEQAEARDAAISTNLLHEMERRKTGVAVLVAGGFHSGGVGRRLVESGIPVLVFSPKVTKVDTANGSAYLSVFTREKTPLEKLFEGEKLFLANDPIAPLSYIDAVCGLLSTGSLDALRSWVRDALLKIKLQTVDVAVEKNAEVDLRVRDQHGRSITIHERVETDAFRRISNIRRDIGWMEVLWGTAALALFAVATKNLAPAFICVALFATVAMVVQTGPGNATPDELDLLLSAGRGLVFSDNADAIDALLFKKAKNSDTRYLRLVLRDQADLDRLLTSVKLKDGELSSKEGKLLDIIRNGGILFIDYNNSDPKMVEGFNSLFDRPSYFNDVKAHDDLKVVGAIKDEHFSRYPISFYSRFRHILSRAYRVDDPVESLRGPPGDFNGVSVELFESPLVRESLLGRYYLDDKGQVQLEKGALIRAIESNQPLLIRGGDWKEAKLADLIRQVLVKCEVEFNGETLQVPDDFRIYRVDGDYAKRPVERKSLISPEETTFVGDLWIVNRENQDILFSRTWVSPEHKLVQRAGLLEHKKLRLRVTDVLADWVWHRILHAPYEIEIELAPGTPVAAAYKKLLSEKLRGARLDPVPKTWEQAKPEKVVFIEGNDLSFIRAEVQRAYPDKKVRVEYVTPEMTLDQLVTSIEIVTGPSEKAEKAFIAAPQKLIEALERGEIVILEGLQSNPALLRQLESALQAAPYLLRADKVEQQPLSQLPGKLILTALSSGARDVRAQNHVKMNADDERLAKILADEAGAKSADVQKIFELRKIFATIPPPSKPQLYPEKANFDLDRLRLLYRFDNWMAAFENVFIGDYAGDPEVAAFMRTMVRSVFHEKEPGLDPKKIHGPKLQRALDKLVPSVEWSACAWQFADTLGVDLLEANHVERSYKALTPAIKRLIQSALIKKNSGERQSFYRRQFNFDGNVSDAADIDTAAFSGQQTWQERKEHIVQMMKKGIPVMLKGSPGTGKSFITSQLASDLGFSENEIEGPITVGSDVKETDVVTRRVFEKGNTVYLDEAVARWAKRPRGLLIVDEANLAGPDFWNFLQSRIDADHLVVFTGNQETLAGRKFSNFIRSRMVTVPFPEFDDAFLTAQITEYLSSHKQRRAQLIDLILSLHRTFEKVGGDNGYSLRDVQELVSRINVFTGEEWTPQQVVLIAWMQYRGVFSPEERLALEQLLMNKFGVSVAEEEADRVKKVQEQRSKYQFIMVESAARTVAMIQDFMRMRSARLEGKSLLQGKRGMFFEGPSGRGKDVVLASVLREQGFVNERVAGEIMQALRDGNRQALQSADRQEFYAAHGEIYDGLQDLAWKVDAPWDAAKALALIEKIEKAPYYFHINASLNYDKMTAVIRRAQREGAPMIVSELNLLPSALLEGKLNDVLTGKAQEGFSFFATINSEDFAGREKLSTALQNRIIYVKESDYSEAELMDIAKGVYKEMSGAVHISDEDLRYAVKAHVWIRDQIKDVRHKPTTRDLLNAINRSMKLRPLDVPFPVAVFSGASPVEKSVNRIYGPIYLEKALNGKIFPSRETLLEYSEKNPVDNVSVIKRMADFVMPPAARPFSLNIDASDPTQSGGYHDSMTNSITLRARAFESDGWRDTLFHEASHGMFTRDFAGLTPGKDDPFRPLFEDLEDLRHTTAFDFHFPYAGLSEPSEAELRFRSLDLESLFQWIHAEKDKLTARKIFQYALTSSAKGLVDAEQLEALARDLDELAVYNVNPFRLALAHLDRAKQIALCIPMRGYAQDDVNFQQYRALKLMHEMKADYLSIPYEAEKEPDPVPETDQKAEVKKSLDRLAGMSLRPDKARVDPSKPAVKPLAAEEIAAKNRAIEEKRRKILEMTRKDLEAELSLIEQDLFSPQGVTKERIDEMELQLRDSKFPFSLVGKLRQLNDDDLNAKAYALVDKILEIKKLFDDPRPEWGRGTGNGIGPRHVRPTAVAHKQEAAYRKNPIRVGEEKKDVAATLVPLRFPGRDAQMNPLSVNYRNDVTRAIAEFVLRTLDPTRVHARDGTILDIEAFISGDPTNAFIKAGGKELRRPKEIIVLDLLAGKATPIVVEALHFLAENGFRLLCPSQPLTAEEVKELRAAAHREVLEVKDLLKKVEAAYVYAAFHSVVQKKLIPIASSEPAALPFSKQLEIVKKFTATKGSPPFVYTLIYIENNFFRYAFVNDGCAVLNESDVIGLNIGASMDRFDLLKNLTCLRYVSITVKRNLGETILRSLATNPNIEELDLAASEIPRLALLIEFKKLMRLSLVSTGFSDDQIFDLFRQHPNRENLQVLNDTGRVLRYDDYLRHNGQEKELSFGQQVERLKRFLEANGQPGNVPAHIPGSPVFFRFVGELDSLGVLAEEAIGLTIRFYAKLNGLDFLKGLTYLRGVYFEQVDGDLLRVLADNPNVSELSLFASKIDDLSPLLKFKRLERLSLVMTGISDSQIYDFFRDHPNREALQVLSNMSELLTYEKYLAQKDSAGISTFEKQISALQELWERIGHAGDEVSEIIYTADAFPTYEFSGIGAMDDGLIGLNYAGDYVKGVEELKNFLNLRVLLLDQTPTTDEELLRVAEIPNLTYLSLAGTLSISDISCLKRLERLEYLDLHLAEGIEDAQIYGLFKDHPNRQNLNVRDYEGRVITYADYLKDAGGEKAEDTSAADVEVALALMKGLFERQGVAMTFSHSDGDFKGETRTFTFERNGQYVGSLRCSPDGFMFLQLDGNLAEIDFSGFDIFLRLEKMEILNMRPEQIQSISKVEHLKSLKLTWTQFSPTIDIFPLMSLRNLKNLELGACVLKNPYDLMVMTQLEALDITKLGIGGSLDFLDGLPKLHTLFLDTDRFKDISALNTLPALTYLGVTIPVKSITDPRVPNIFMLFQHFVHPDNVTVETGGGLKFTHADVPEDYLPKKDPVLLPGEEDILTLVHLLYEQGVSAGELTPPNPASRHFKLFVGTREVGAMLLGSDAKIFLHLDLGGIEFDFSGFNGLTYLTDMQISNLYPDRIPSLSNISHLKILRLVWTLSQPSISISSLQQLKKLTRLSLQGCSLLDSGAFQRMTQLEYLDIEAASGIKDLNFLEHLSNLKTFYFDPHSFLNFSSLRFLSQLEHLGVNSPITGADDPNAAEIFTLFQYLPHPENVTVQTATHAEFTYADLPDEYKTQPAEDGTALLTQELQTIMDSFADEGVAFKESSLGWPVGMLVYDLFLANKRVGMVSVYSYGSIEIDLSGLPEFDFHNFEKLTSVKALHLDDMSSPYLMFVSRVQSLQSLSVQWNGDAPGQVNLASFHGLKNLKKLSLVDCLVADPAALSGFPQLEELDLFSATNVASLEFLRSMTHLKGFSFRPSAFSDLSPLLSLENLIRIHINSIAPSKIFKLFEYFVHPEIVTVGTDSGLKFTYDDVPEEYKPKTEFPEDTQRQLNAIAIALLERGVSLGAIVSSADERDFYPLYFDASGEPVEEVGRIYFNEDGTLELSFSQLRAVPDFDGFEAFDKIVALDISTIMSIPSLTFLMKLPYLRSLALSADEGLESLGFLPNLQKLWVDYPIDASDPRIEAVYSLFAHMAHPEKVRVETSKGALFTYDDIPAQYKRANDVKAPAQIETIRELLKAQQIFMSEKSFRYGQGEEERKVYELYAKPEGEDVAEIAGRLTLEANGTLDLSFFKLRTPIRFSGFENLDLLKSLSFEDSYFFDPADIAQIKSLVSVSLSWGIGGPDIDTAVFQSMTHLKQLSLIYCGIKNPSSAFEGLSQLESLDVTAVSDVLDFEFLKKLPNLKVLGLDYERFNLSPLRSLPSLKRLMISEDVKDRDDVRIPQVYSLFQYFANPEGAHIVSSVGARFSYDDIPDGEKPNKKAKAVEAPRVDLPLTDSLFLKKILNGLLNPVETLAAVQKRFEEEGQGGVFNALLESIAMIPAGASAEFARRLSQLPAPRELPDEHTVAAPSTAVERVLRGRTLSLDLAKLEKDGIALARRSKSEGKDFTDFLDAFWRLAGDQIGRQDLGALIADKNVAWPVGEGTAANRRFVERLYEFLSPGRELVIGVNSEKDRLFFEQWLKDKQRRSTAQRTVRIISSRELKVQPLLEGRQLNVDTLEAMLDSIGAKQRDNWIALRPEGVSFTLAHPSALTWIDITNGFFGAALGPVDVDNLLRVAQTAWRNA